MLACCLPHPGYHHNSLHQRPRQVELQFRSPCHCDLRPRLPVHFVILGRLPSIHQHPTCDDDRLPPSVQWHCGENASAAVEGGFGGTPIFYVLAFGAALGPPRPQEGASGAVLCFFRRICVWHTTDSPWTIPVDARASGNGVSRQSPPPHGSLLPAAFGAWSIAPRVPCICRLHSGKRSTCSSAEMVLVLPSHPCMTAHTGLFNVPTHIFASLSVTGRTRFGYQDSSLCLLLVLWCLLCLAVEAALLASSLLRSLLLFHVVEAALLASSLKLILH